MTAHSCLSAHRSRLRIVACVALAPLVAAPASREVVAQSPGAVAAAPNDSRRDGIAVAPAAQGAAAPKPLGILAQEELTGDWGGVRTRWRDKGLVFDSSFTQFYQGVTAGGTDTGSEYNATAQAKLEFDFGKLLGWQWWSAEVKGEWRFGGPLLGATIVMLLKNYVSGYVERWNMLMGFVFVLIVLFMPEGVVPGLQRLWRRFRSII